MKIMIRLGLNTKHIISTEKKTIHKGLSLYYVIREYALIISILHKEDFLNLLQYYICIKGVIFFKNWKNFDLL